MNRYKILIVDDDEELAYPLSERLNFRGFDVEVATNWADSLKLFEYHSFNLALLDIKLPGMNGLDLMKMMKNIQKDLKIILMSGHGTEEDAKECISKGACVLMIKPIKIDVLIKKINEILQVNN